MNNQEILGMGSANAAAKEMPYGSNMTISAALVIEMVKRIVELEALVDEMEDRIVNELRLMSQELKKRNL